MFVLFELLKNMGLIILYSKISDIRGSISHILSERWNGTRNDREMVREMIAKAPVIIWRDNKNMADSSKPVVKDGLKVILIPGASGSLGIIEFIITIWKIAVVVRHDLTTTLHISKTTKRSREALWPHIVLCFPLA